MRNFIVSVISIVAIGAWAVPGAAARQLSGGDLIAGPVLAGARAVWVDQVGRRLLIRGEALSGRAPRTWVEPAVGYRPERVWLAGSATQVAVDAAFGGTSKESDERYRNVFTGPPNRPLAPLERHCTASATYPRTIDVSGDEAIYVDCADDPAVINLATGQTQTLPGSTVGLHIAGRYAAWLGPGGGSTTDTITVYDLKLGAVAYSLPVRVNPDGVEDLDLQDDGTVAFAYAAPPSGGGDGPQFLGWASIAAPYQHALPVKASANYKVRLVNGRVAFDRGSDAGSLVVAPVTYGYVDLDGTAEHIVASGGSEYAFGDEFDFDGRHLAWFSRGCNDTIIHVSSIGRYARAHRGKCRLALTRPPTVRRRRVTLNVNCVGFAQGDCDAQRVRITRAGELIARGPDSASTRLTTRGRRLLRGRRSLAVRISATLSDATGHEERRTGGAKLRAAN